MINQCILLLSWVSCSPLSSNLPHFSSFLHSQSTVLLPILNIFTNYWVHLKFCLILLGRQEKWIGEWKWKWKTFNHVRLFVTPWTVRKRSNASYCKKIFDDDSNHNGKEYEKEHMHIYIHIVDKERAVHSSALAWRIPWT